MTEALSDDRGASTRTKADRERLKRGAAASTKPGPDLRVLQTQVFRGPNYWSYESCIRMLVDLGSLEEWPSNRIPGFAAVSTKGYKLTTTRSTRPMPCCRASCRSSG